MSRTTLVAEPGMMFTNGKETTGYEIQLAVGEDSSDFKQIPEEEFFAMIEGQELPNREHTETDIKNEEE